LRSAFCSHLTRRTGQFGEQVIDFGIAGKVPGIGFRNPLLNLCDLPLVQFQVEPYCFVQDETPIALYLAEAATTLARLEAARTVEPAAYLA
jgi:hypothetical protein